MAPKSHSSGKILTYGRDQLLLETRGLILSGAGYEPVLAGSRSEFESHLQEEGRFGLAVLCHTIDQIERDEIEPLIRERRIPVYALPTGVPPKDFIANVAALLENGEESFQSLY
jgi:hypothetical protein